MFICVYVCGWKYDTVCVLESHFVRCGMFYVLPKTRRNYAPTQNWSPLLILVLIKKNGNQILCTSHDHGHSVKYIRLWSTVERLFLVEILVHDLRKPCGNILRCHFRRCNSSTSLVYRTIEALSLYRGECTVRDGMCPVRLTCCQFTCTILPHTRYTKASLPPSLDI